MNQSIKVQATATPFKTPLGLHYPQSPWTIVLKIHLNHRSQNQTDGTCLGLETLVFERQRLWFYENLLSFCPSLLVWSLVEEPIVHVLRLTVEKRTREQRANKLHADRTAWGPGIEPVTSKARRARHHHAFRLERVQQRWLQHCDVSNLTLFQCYSSAMTLFGLRRGHDEDWAGLVHQEERSDSFDWKDDHFYKKCTF